VAAAPAAPRCDPRTIVLVPTYYELESLPLFVERFAPTGLELLIVGYAFPVETTQLAHLAGARIEEVPFVFSERVAGSSKMTLRISLEGIRVTLALRRHHRPHRRARLAVAL
jgi:hypothetical protein